MMAEKDGLTELAKLFKARDPISPSSVTTGIVISPPPNPQIRLNDVIVLDKGQLVFASQMLKEIIHPNDEVILIPVMDGQLYYVIDKAVRF